MRWTWTSTIPGITKQAVRVQRLPGGQRLGRERRDPPSFDVDVQAFAAAAPDDDATLDPEVVHARRSLVRKEVDGDRLAA
jgi:hypothetical protein